MLERIPVSYNNNFLYDIVLNNSFGGLGEELKKIGTEARKICIVSETNVAPIYLEAVKEKVKGACQYVTEYVFEAGERNKTLDTVRALYTHLIEEHFDRNDYLIALGGGVTGDLTGYAAATYLRGIKFIQIPTTLLSQVDSSIGGKTGVDFDSYKNMVGAFHQPSLVYINYKTLDSLPEREYLSGMGEVIKHGIIKNKIEFQWLCDNAASIVNRSDEVMVHMLSESIKVKRQVVENDPKEKGERALLNFGHTIGHAIEKHMDFTLFHGECVAVGSVLAAKLSLDKGFIDKAQYNEIIEAFKAFKLPVSVAAFELTEKDIEKIVDNTLNDKKMDAGVVKFILVESIGNAIIDKTIDVSMMKKVLEESWSCNE